MVKVLILGPTLLQRVTEPELDVEVEEPTAIKVLIEGNSRKSDQDFCGRNSQNKMLVFPKKEGLKPGDYAMVRVKDATSATLLGEIV